MKKSDKKQRGRPAKERPLGSSAPYGKRLENARGPHSVHATKGFVAVATARLTYSGRWAPGGFHGFYMGDLSIQALSKQQRLEQTRQEAAPHSDFEAPSDSWLPLAVGFLVLLAGLYVYALNVRWLRLRRARRRRPKRSLDNELGSSDLAQAKEFKPWLRPPKPLDTALNVKDVRGARWSIRSARLSIPPGERNRHILIVGKTGGGKTTRGILPLLYQDCLCPFRSTIVLDSKSEMWHLLAQMTQKYNPNKQLLLFNPLDQARSLSWNIVEKVTSDAEAKLVATSIIAASDNPHAKSDTPFFRNSALQLLNSIMVGLITDPRERLSMPRVHQLLNSGKLALCDWLNANEEAARCSRTFIELAQSGSQNADTVISELSMRLSAWDIAAVRATTFFDELDLNSLVSHPTLLVVELRESELEMLRPMANTIVVELLRFLTRRAEREHMNCLPNPVGLVIDEFASALGRLPDIHVKLNTLRSRNVSIVGSVQSLGQITSAYGSDGGNVIAGFGTKIFIPPLEQVDADWASKESGTMTVRYNTKSRNRSRRVMDGFYHRDQGKQEIVQQRAVLTPDEIARAAGGASTFFLPGLSAFQALLLPYFEIQEMRERIGSSKEELCIRLEPLLDPAKSLDAHQAQFLLTYDGDSSTTDPTESVADVLGEMKPLLEWDEASDEELEWWQQLEADNAEQLSGLIMLVVELIRRGASLSDLFRAYSSSDSDSMEDLIDVVDEQLQQAAEAKRVSRKRFAG